MTFCPSPADIFSLSFSVHFFLVYLCFSTLNFNLYPGLPSFPWTRVSLLHLSLSPMLSFKSVFHFQINFSSMRMYTHTFAPTFLIIRKMSSIEITALMWMFNQSHLILSYLLRADSSIHADHFFGQGCCYSHRVPKRLVCSVCCTYDVAAKCAGYCLQTDGDEHGLICV